MSGNQKTKKFVNVLLCVVLTTFVTSLFAATRHALVVGVSNYPQLNQYLQLKGPPNDVKLIVTLLDSVGFKTQNIIVLVEGQNVKTLPTAKNIRLAFKKLLQETESGDFVYMHFSGHGSQQPVDPNNIRQTEPDGLDEIFLPRDVKNWNEAIGSVENGIVDNEINQIVTQLREKEVFVWLVFDSCHAGTMAKNLALFNGEIRRRSIDPSQLGIPVERLQTSKQEFLLPNAPINNPEIKNKSVLDISDSQFTKKLAGYIAFYASHPSESTVEFNLPDHGPNKRPLGLFTWTLYEILSQNKTLSYKALAEQILKKYAERDTEFTPMFEGNRFTAKVFERR